METLNNLALMLAVAGGLSLLAMLVEGNHPRKG